MIGRSGETKMRRRCQYDDCTPNESMSSEPKPCRTFQRSQGNIPRTASGAAIQTCRKARGCFQSVHAIRGSAIGTICDVSQYARPSTSPKTPTRVRSGRSTTRNARSISRAQ